MAYDLEKIAAAVKAAAGHAKAVADFEDWDDGGTCNFDSAYLRAPRMTEEEAKRISELSGVGCYLLKSKIFGRTLQLCGALEGQGNRRTRMAEAMRTHLCEAGFEANMWYQMD